MSCPEPSPARRAPELWAAPGAPNFGHGLWDPLAVSGQHGELLALCPAGLGVQSQAGGPCGVRARVCWEPPHT